MMPVLLLAEGILLASGLLALVAPIAPRVGARIGPAGAGVASLIGMAVALNGLLMGVGDALVLPWAVPRGSFHVEIDALSAFFLLPTFLIAFLAALYGKGYLSGRERRSLGPAWFWFNLLVASMVMVIVARNALLFLVAWELMTLSSYFLVTFDRRNERAQEAGWIYLIAAHLGTAFLLVLFMMLGREAAVLDFGAFAVATPAAPGLLFLLAVVGFGTKAGFLPLHVWLPEAHPAAPAHVSALMSGVMIKMGIYGLLRTLSFLGPPARWWGWLLILIGLSSGILGVLYALAQHDLKRLLAYHSVENIGIIACGLGVGVLGSSSGYPFLAALGFAGALFHVLNHALFKALLFLGAGAVVQRTGTGELEHLGGLLKRMPWTGATFLTGAVAISGLPPLNGFVSEFLLFLGAFRGAATLPARDSLPSLLVITGLGLIGGLAAACFAKAFGIVFLGCPRSAAASDAREVGPAMLLPSLFLAAACLAVGLLSPYLVPGLAPVVSSVTRVPESALREELAGAGTILSQFVAVALILVGLLLLLALFRKRMLLRRPVGKGVTWDCGYVAPTARMQYTASSFAQPLLDLFGPLLGTSERTSPPAGTFPCKASFASVTPDAFLRGVFLPGFAGMARGLAWFRRLQEGRVQVYVLYIAVTLLVLLVWLFGARP